jgi:hypothetical protein
LKKNPWNSKNKLKIIKRHHYGAFFVFVNIYNKNIIMPRINDIHSIIVPAQSPNMTAHTYTEIYGGTAGCTIVLNGVTVSVASSSNIPLWVRTVSGGTGCYLLGENKDVFGGSPNLP